MSNTKIKTYYRTRLPHLQPIGALFFVTFQLYGAIPKVMLQKLQEEQAAALKLADELNCSKKEIYLLKEQQCYDYDELLDKRAAGPHHLKEPVIAEHIINTLFRFDGQFYDLQAYCIMSNHVHILIDTSIQLPEDGSEPTDYVQLDQIMKRIKGPTGVAANRFLKRKGQFWNRESYDHCVRNPGAAARIQEYILNNPKKAGLVSNWKDWPYTYCKP